MNGKGAMPALSPLAMFLNDEMTKQSVTITELERRTEIPDATLGRILNGEVAEPKASQIAAIAKALGLKFWYVMQRGGFTTEVPDALSAEAQRLAVVFSEDQELSTLLKTVERLEPRDRDVVLAYVADLERRRESRQKVRRRNRRKDDPQNAGGG